MTDQTNRRDLFKGAAIASVAAAAAPAADLVAAARKQAADTEAGGVERSAAAMDARGALRVPHRAVGAQAGTSQLTGRCSARRRRGGRAPTRIGSFMAAMWRRRLVQALPLTSGNPAVRQASSRREESTAV